ncbi:MAG: hypothetical protein IAI48_12310 [Candidatus Eremiobacteraeota bacterium]|nr:hypothetical protein [Candidatus Eremiobacteraeota bacterium]
MRRFTTFALLLVAFFALEAKPKAAEAASCSVATGIAAHVLCWLDLTTYTPTPGAATALSFSLPDGSTLSATFTNTSTTVTPTIAAFPTYSGSALGQTAYTGVTGKPAVYGGGVVPTKLSGIKVVDADGTTLASTTIAAADAETLDTGDGTSTTAYLDWTTAGTNWSQLQIMNSLASGTTTPICTLSGLNTQTASCVPSSGGNNAAYILSTTVTPSQAVTLASKSTALQGYAFAAELSTLALAKKVNSRLNAGDQFTVTLKRGATTLATATTSGTATTATTASVVTMPTDTYTMSETAAGTTALGYYASTYACVNANTSSTTTLPSGSGTSFTISPAADDQITCTFTNTALTLTNVPVNATKDVTEGASVTDVFTLTNTSAVAGTFGGTSAPTVTTTTGTSITPTGYTFNGTAYTSVTALYAAVQAAGPYASGASITIGITYTEPTTVGTVVDVVVAADITSGTGTSALASATEVDTSVVNAAVSLVKSGTTATSPGGLIGYTIVASSSSGTENGAIVSDPVPAGLTINGKPTCAASGGAVCGTVTVSGNTVSSTIGTFPSGSQVTITILATAGANASYTNTATLTPPSGGGAAVTSSLTTTVAQANGISKTVRNVTTGTPAGTADIAVPNNQLEYALTMQNTTGFAIHGVTISDPLPAQTTFLSATCGTLPTGVTSCAVTSPAVGTTGTVTFTYTGTLAAGSSLTALIETLVK